VCFHGKCALAVTGDELAALRHSAPHGVEVSLNAVNKVVTFALAPFFTPCQIKVLTIIRGNQVFKLLHGKLASGKSLTGTELASLAPAPLQVLKNMGLVRHGLKGLQLCYA
jgi:hypothetical protein